MSFNAQDSLAALAAVQRGDLGMIADVLRKGYLKPAVDETGATFTLTIDRHEGRLTRQNRGGGFAATLPAAVGSQAEFRLFIVATVGASTIKVANSTDVMQGSVLINLAAGGVGLGWQEAAAGTDDTLSMNGTTLGGIAGSYVFLKDVVAGFWMIDARLVGSGALATPLSATV